MNWQDFYTAIFAFGVLALLWNIQQWLKILNSNIEKLINTLEGDIGTDEE